MSDVDFGFVALAVLAAICVLVFALDWRGYRRCQRDEERPGPKPTECDWSEIYAASEQGEQPDAVTELP